MKIVIFINCIGFAFSYFILIHKLLAPKTRVAMFIIIFTAELICNLHFKQYRYLLFYFTVLITSIGLYKNQKNMIKSLNYALSSLCCLHALLTLSSCLIFLLTSSNSSYHTIFFKFLIQIGIIIFSLLLNHYRILDYLNLDNQKSMKLSLINNISYFIFINYIITYFYQKISLEMYYLICFFVVFFDSLTKILLLLSNRMNLELKLKEQELLLLKINSEHIERKHRELIQIKNDNTEMAIKFTDFMNQNDSIGIVQFFDDQMAPAYMEHLWEKTMLRQLALINEPLIKGLISEFLHNLASKQEIIVDLEIYQDADIPDDNLLTIYKIVKLFLNDAYEELAKNSKGCTYIKLYNDADTLRFSLDNYLGQTHQKEHVESSSKHLLDSFLKKNANIRELITVKDSGFLFQRMTIELR